MKKRTLLAVIGATVISTACGGGGGGGGNSTPTPVEPTNLTKTQVIETLNEEGLSCRAMDLTITNPNNGTQYIQVPITGNISCNDPVDGMTTLVLYGPQTNSQISIDQYNGAPFNLQTENITGLDSTTDTGLAKILANEIKNTTPAPGLVVLDANGNPYTYQAGDLVDVFGIGTKRLFVDIYSSLDQNLIGTIEVLADVNDNYTLPQLETQIALNQENYELDFRVLNQYNIESVFLRAGAYTLSAPPQQGGGDPNGGNVPEI